MITPPSVQALEERLEQLAATALDEMDVAKWPELKTSLGRQERYRIQLQAARTLDTMLQISSLLEMLQTQSRGR